jgi:hypothetical protein
MRAKYQQRGMTMWGLVFVLAVLAFAIFLVFKLFPPYMTDFKVRNALSGLVKESGFGEMTKAEIKDRLERRFSIDDIRLNDTFELTIQEGGREKRVRIKYEEVVPMVANISALLQFDHEQRVRAVE